MLPSATALKLTSLAGFNGSLVHCGVDPLLIGSALHRVSLFGFTVYTGISAAPGSFPRLLWLLLTSRTPIDGEISPGKSALLRRTAAAFTFTGIPVAFGMLCHLDAPCRPSMRFLFIGSRLSLSLPSPSRSPFPSWLQMVVSS